MNITAIKIKATATVYGENPPNEDGKSSGTWLRRFKVGDEVDMTDAEAAATLSQILEGIGFVLKVELGRINELKPHLLKNL